ncbi:MAG: helix-turn-helix transcriptional regulator [Oscillospiraceae bacterium]|nr:helix-turn-helix transcriptional regulator [Candidatus Limimonas coprohippi]MCQ2488103.1 helix-turn-helix transcriptional regulator [Clostridia bacterium]
MGRMSVKDDKTVYQLAREELDLSREKASELIGVSPSTLEKLENGDTRIQPDHVNAMSDAYKKAELRNYYCSHECPIGIRDVPELEVKDLARVALEVSVALDNIKSQEERLRAICVDDVISDTEQKEISKILDDLDKLSTAIDSLKIAVENMK